MTTYILNTNLIYYASRLEKKDAHTVIFGTQYKTVDSDNKSSKIDVQYETPSNDIHLYTKPRCFVKNYIYDPNFIYVGVLETDWTITEDDHEQIRKMCEKFKIIPIFSSPGDFSILIEDMLNADTFNYTHTKLNHGELYDKYCKFNDKVKLALGNVKESDLLWAHDFNFIHVLAQYKNTALTLSNFNDLWKCIPFYKLLLDDILEVKLLHFTSNQHLKDFERFVSYTYFPDSKKLPKSIYKKIGIDKTFIDSYQITKSIEKNTIIIPYESVHHLICLDRYLNKYDVPIKINLLNINNSKLISREILNYVNYLQLKTNVDVITPETDEEFIKLLSTCQIGFYQCLNEYSKFFGRHIIESCVYDYENVADEIYKKLHYVEQHNNEISDMNEDIHEILNSIKCRNEIEYKNEAIEMSNISKMDQISDVKKQIIVREDDNNEEDTCPSRLVESTKTKKTRVHIKDLPLENISAVILDYDGTLVPICSNPDDSHLSEESKKILLELNKKIKVVIASGRRKEDMDKFIPKEIEVFSEHCGFVRKDDEWCTLFSNINFDLELRIARFYKERTPGSFIEEKSNGFVFHYRECDPIIGTLQAQRLYTDLIKISPFIKLGKKIVEYKIGNKQDIFKHYKNNLIICGDDVTDEDMFDNARGMTIRVGYCDKTKAEYFVRDVDEMLLFLKHLIK